MRHVTLIAIGEAPLNVQVNVFMYRQVTGASLRELAAQFWATSLDLRLALLHQQRVDFVRVFDYRTTDQHPNVEYPSFKGIQIKGHTVLPDFRNFALAVPMFMQIATLHKVFETAWHVPSTFVNEDDELYQHYVWAKWLANHHVPYYDMW